MQTTEYNFGIKLIHTQCANSITEKLVYLLHLQPTYIKQIRTSKVRHSYLLVELAGIEPASKRGSNMPSTCLSPDLIFE